MLYLLQEKLKNNVQKAKSNRKKQLFTHRGIQSTLFAQHNDQIHRQTH